MAANNPSKARLHQPSMSDFWLPAPPVFLSSARKQLAIDSPPHSPVQPAAVPAADLEAPPTMIYSDSGRFPQPAAYENGTAHQQQAPDSPLPVRVTVEDVKVKVPGVSNHGDDEAEKGEQEAPAKAGGARACMKGTYESVKRPFMKLRSFIPRFMYFPLLFFSLLAISAIWVLPITFMYLNQVDSTAMDIDCYSWYTPDSGEEGPLSLFLVKWGGRGGMQVCGGCMCGVVWGGRMR